MRLLGGLFRCNIFLPGFFYFLLFFQVVGRKKWLKNDEINWLVVILTQFRRIALTKCQRPLKSAFIMSRLPTDWNDQQRIFLFYFLSEKDMTILKNIGGTSIRRAKFVFFLFFLYCSLTTHYKVNQMFSFHDENRSML